MKLKDEENAQVGETYLSCIWPSKHNIQITEKVTQASKGKPKSPQKNGPEPKKQFTEEEV